MPPRQYQVIIIGGGHAGVEAAWAAANLLPTASGEPASVALITLDPSKIGVMSCNPAIGGLAKGQLVREIDALGGLMGLATDATGIQFKVLNTSKGQAVHGPRAQCDKHAYAEAVQALIRSRPEIDVIAGSVEEFIVDNGRITGVMINPASFLPPSPPALKFEISNSSSSSSSSSSPLATPHSPFALSAPSIVLTTGTFMRGLMHTGESQTPGGRFGEAAASGISAALRSLGFELGRLKTGTPPRLKKSTIDWESLPPQYGDETPTPFSDLSGALSNAQCPVLSTFFSSTSAQCPIPSAYSFPFLPQLECRQTHTSAAAHELIRANLHRAPMYSGQIESAGPRYCPSIEDKVVRFAQRDTHGVFLEPESLRDDWIYCNGISTSLPADIQDAIVRSMPGCGRAHIYRYGYAVEYDMVRPHQIHATGMTKLIDGLFLAGQINGTSGYEEAAAQGFIAGLNAARFAKSQPLITLGRDEAYIGVLMDDLVTKTPVEPYRMFTSRAEHRLLLRADNAADRLTTRAIEWGLLDSTDLGQLRKDLFAQRQRDIRDLNARIDRIKINGDPLGKLIRTPDFTANALAHAVYADDATDGASRVSERSMAAVEVDSMIEPPLPALRERDGVRASTSSTSSDTPPSSSPEHLSSFPPSIISTVFAERRYAAYIARQHAEVKRHAEMEHRHLPSDLDYTTLDSLRNEARQSLARFRPSTFGQAARLEGITPADLTLLAILVQKHKKRSDRAMT